MIQLTCPCGWLYFSPLAIKPGLRTVFSALQAEWGCVGEPPQAAHDVQGAQSTQSNVFAQLDITVSSDLLQAKEIWLGKGGLLKLGLSTVLSLAGTG